MVRTFIREKKIFCGDHYREVDIFGYTTAQKNAAARGKRSKKVQESEPKQKNLNDKNARRYFVQLGNLNFGDDPEALHVTATYSAKHLPRTVEAAEKEVSNYLRRVAYARKKEGLPPLKYMLMILGFRLYCMSMEHGLTFERIKKASIPAITSLTISQKKMV